MIHSIPLPLRAGLVAGLLVATAFSAEPPAIPARVARTPAELTAEDFFRPQTVNFAQLNPAGTHLAMLVYDAKTDSNGLRILELGTRKHVLLPGSKIYDVHRFQWVGDERIVFTVVRDNLYATGLYLVHRELKKPPSVLNENDLVQVLGTPEARPDHLLVWVEKDARAQGRPGPLVEIKLREGQDRGFDVDFSRVTGTVAPPPGEAVVRWVTDRTGEIRYAYTQSKGEIAFHRREADGSWTRLLMDLEKYRPLAVDAAPDVLFVARLTADGLRELVRANTRDGSTGPVLYRDPKYDFSEASVYYSHDQRDVLGFGYNRQAPTQVWLTDTDTRLQSLLNAALPPNRINLITGRSRDGSRLLIRSSSDRHRGSLYLFEPQAGTMNLVADYAPWLPESLLGPVQLISYKARDGLLLDAYVTLPLDYAPGKPAPMVVLPHGGPWLRDFWAYDAASAFLASRGYVVFRPNYRGSSGYSADISFKPRMEFLKMHEDVTDGVRTLIKSGIADPARIAIVGSSFGGYLAVAGAAFEPGLYRCAATIAGVFDWKRILQEGRRSDPLPYARLIRELGDPRKEEEKFEAMSPIHSAGKIKIPIFIAHGESDPVVGSGQSHRLARALAESGVPCETMFETWEGHGFSSLANQAELHRRIEAFLKKHL